MNESAPPITTEQVAEWLKQLRLAVITGASEARQRLHQQWRKPLGERVAAGVALADICISANGQNGELHLTCPVNRSRFREGDLLLLHRGDPFEAPHITVTLEEDDETTLLVLIEDVGVDYGALLREPTGWVLDETIVDMSTLIVSALDEVADSSIGREQILPLLHDERTPLLDMQRYADAEAYAHAHGLNPDQTEALAASYATNLAYLIQGPPGTGKTRVLAHLARLLVQDGERVFITAHTHRAINHALNTVVQLAAEDPPAIKVGQPARAQDLLVTNYEYFNQSPLAEAESGYVVGATPFATRTRRLSDVSFDTVILDEASQITLPLAIMAMLKGRRYIIVGDHQQLPPVGSEQLAPDALDRSSIFALLVGRGYDTLLTQTYRMNAELTRWPSQQFYAGRLQPATPAIATRRICYPQPPSQFHELLDPATPAIWGVVEQHHATRSNAAEAQLVAELIETLLECGLTPAQIGVVSPYRIQAREICRRLNYRGMAYDLRRQLVIDTVERLQGQERDLIIVTLTTGARDFAATVAAFLFQPQRLNVAITRPRTKLIVLASPTLLDVVPEDATIAAHVDLLADFLHSLPTYPIAQGAS